MKRTEIEVTNRIVIPFDWIDPTPGGKNLGRAEFTICLKFKRGKVVEYWVDPIQTRLTEKWHYTEPTSWGDFTINSYEGLDEAKAWQYIWCHDHKTFAMRVYAPEGARYLALSTYGIEFYRTKIS